MVGYFLLILLSVFLLEHSAIRTLVAPVILAPLFIVSLGLSFIISSLGVYFKDSEQISQFIMSMLLFLTPVFYPAKNIPEDIRWCLTNNILGFTVENFRNFVVFNVYPDFHQLYLHLVSAVIVFIAGLIWFEIVKKGFADVI